MNLGDKGSWVRIPPLRPSTDLDLPAINELSAENMGVPFSTYDRVSTKPFAGCRP